MAMKHTVSRFHKDFTWEANGAGWKWARLTVWDVAGTGAFTTPIWKN
jgi:hypothetical protein